MASWKHIFITFLLFGFASSQQQNCSSPIQTGTFNLLQISFAPYKSRRLDAAINYLRSNEPDLSILCLQELWDVDQRTELVNGLRSRYPHSLAATPIPTSCNGGCSSDELNTLRRCLDDNDCSLLSSNIDECANTNCRGQLESVGARCATCLQSGNSVGDVFRNLDNCLDDNDTPSTNQSCYAFEGQSDNLLLSTIPFDATDVLYFSESPITVTTALYGRLTTSIGVTHVFCTHLLPADLPVFTFEQAVNLNQSMQLLQWADSKVGNSSDAVLILGDFNHGPREWEENYDWMISQGYISAYTQAGNTNCTYCDSNPLSMGDSLIIDHIYLRNAYQTSSERFATYADYNLESIDIPFIDFDRIPISDHYGVRASVCYGQSNSSGILARNVRVTDTDYIPGRISSNASILMPLSLVLSVILLAM